MIQERIRAEMARRRAKPAFDPDGPITISRADANDLIDVLRRTDADQLRLMLERLVAPPPVYCAGCGKKLTDEEVEFLGDWCGRCEQAMAEEAETR